jgi:ParB-like chromosome segregation protein Spo0J
MAKTWKVHPTALAFPRMPVAEYNELKADIAARGIRLPILVNKNRDTILDGRNRMMVAHDLNLKDGEVPIEVFTGELDEEVGEIISRNIHRRHLTDDQRVAIVAKLRGPQLAKEAEERQKAGQASDLGLKSTQGRTRELIAAEADASQHKARSALMTAKHAPFDLDMVIAGKEKLAKAHANAKAKAKKSSKLKPQKSLRERVEAKFVRFMESFAVTEYREVRAILQELLAITKR